MDLTIIGTTIITLMLNAIVILVIAYFVGKAVSRGIYRSLKEELEPLKQEIPKYIHEISVELQKMHTLERAIQSKKP